VRTLGEARLLALSVQDLRALSNEVTDSAYLVLLRNQLTRRHADLRRSSDTAVDSLERQLEEANKRLATGSLLGFIIFVMCVYNFILRDSIDAITAAGNGTPVTTGLIVFYLATIYVMIRRSDFRLRTYGLSIDNWRPAAREALLWSAIFAALLAGLKWLCILLVPAWQGLPLFELYAYQHVRLGEILLTAGLYVLFAPAQEFIARGALQSSFRELLGGRFVTTRAIAYSTLMFSAMHVHLSTSFALMALVPSVFWGIMYARQGTLVGVSISHVLLGLWTVFFLGPPGLA